MKITDIVTEAANPAQQAAIAISMKKAGKKPQSEGVFDMFKSKSEPLPDKPETFTLGKFEVELLPPGKRHIGFAWKDSQGRQHYEEVSTSGPNRINVNNRNELIARIKDDIEYQEKQIKKSVAEGYILKKTNVSKYMEPGDPDEYTQDVNVKDTDYEIINNKTGQVVGTASWTTNDFFGPGALKITMKNGATRWLDIWEREKGNPQSAFNRFVKDPKTAKKYKDEQGVAEGVFDMFKSKSEPLPDKPETFTLGKFEVELLPPGKRHIGFAWKDSQGREHYEEVSTSGPNRINVNNRNELIARIKGTIEFQEKQIKKSVAESTELAEEFDLIESIVEQIAEHNGVDAEAVWEDLESLTEDELYVFAVTSDPLMESEAWQKANNRDKTDGMSRKAVNTYRREHPGSKLQTAVTTKPSKLKKGSKASKRRSSYCSRSRGQMKMHSISCSKTPDKAICKARRRWNC